jgi:hypothetical protein
MGRVRTARPVVFGAALVLAAGLPAASPARTPAAASPGGFRILYSSDWSGTNEIYAADPSGRHPIAQLTFGWSS